MVCYDNLRVMRFVRNKQSVRRLYHSDENARLPTFRRANCSIFIFLRKSRKNRFFLHEISNNGSIILCNRVESILA